MVVGRRRKGVKRRERRARDGIVLFVAGLMGERAMKGETLMNLFPVYGPQEAYWQ
jgi:hypothetical protein